MEAVKRKQWCQRCDIFLSFAQEDREFAENVKVRLQTKKKLKVFVPSEGLVPYASEMQCVYMCTCVSTCMHVCVHVCLPVCMCVYMCVYLYACVCFICMHLLCRQVVCHY